VKSNLNILVAASEAAPLVRTSYMGDVVSALPQALKDLGVLTSLVIPRYSLIPDTFEQECIAKNISIPMGDTVRHAGLYRTHLNNIPVYLIDLPEYYHNRTSLYRNENGDYPDNAERFIFFSRAVVEMLPYYASCPTIIHCNDWQTGLIPLYLERYRNTHSEFANVKSLFTVHNLSIQGLFWRFDMHLTGLPWDYFTPNGIEFYGDINLLKAGLLYCDAINTVSPRYCHEIQTPEFGCGLEGVLQSMSYKLHGILNGVNYELWSPDKNTAIPAPYNTIDLSGKSVCKTRLCNESGFQNENPGPLMAMISPLYSRKGLDLLEFIMPDLAQRGVSVILQGIGDRNYVQVFSDLQNKYPDSFRFIHDFKQSTSQKILAGSDFILIPSRFEPCGLNQLYALRFGTIPIVHRTGGLDNTVIDNNYDASGSQTGFKFSGYSAESFLESIVRALSVYKNQSAMNQLIRSAMSQDFSWKQSAAKYLKLYNTMSGRA
jgi:starch synthase